MLGNGVNYIFPPENEKLYKDILKKGGAIISEYEENVLPCPEGFRQRNRIVSGLSVGILIVEAAFRSGTSITAKFARKQGRDVFCIPNSRTNNKGVGTNMQIQKGARLVLDPKDIIEKYTDSIAEQISIEELENQNKKHTININNIKEEYKEIYKVLKEELSINEISKKTNIQMSEIYQKLFLMEIDGLIQCKKNKYKRIK